MKPSKAIEEVHAHFGGTLIGKGNPILLAIRPNTPIDGGVAQLVTVTGRNDRGWVDVMPNRRFDKLAKMRRVTYVLPRNSKAIIERVQKILDQLDS